MKKCIEHIIQLRNPDFKFDTHLSNRDLISFFFQQSMAFIRGLKFVIFFRNPKFMLLGKRTEFINLHKISFGKFLKIGSDVKIAAYGKQAIHLGNNVSIGDFSRLILCTTLNNLGEHITIGNNVGIGEFAYIGGAGGLTISDDCIIGQYLSCHPENHNYSILGKNIRFQGVQRFGIHIGKNCWIGSKVTILDGVKIGDNCVIAAGAVVKDSFPENSVIAGVPAKLVKTRI